MISPTRRNHKTFFSVTSGPLALPPKAGERVRDKKIFYALAQICSQHCVEPFPGCVRFNRMNLFYPLSPQVCFVACSMWRDWNVYSIIGQVIRADISFARVTPS